MSQKPTELEVLEAYYQSGIGIAAVNYGIRVRILSLGHESATCAGFPLEPLSDWLAGAQASELLYAELVQDYVTACLSGDAARFLRAEARRCALKRSAAGAGPELRQLRLLWECLEPESERAYVVALAQLARFDEGNPEATMYRLWQKAVRLLRQFPHRQQLDRLARHLLRVGELSCAEIVAFLRMCEPGDSDRG